MRKERLLLMAVLAVSLLPRLHGVENPLVGTHSWRQTDTAAMARNFLEEGRGFLRPAIDWRGETDGAVECEFPAYPYLVSLLYRLFGVHEALGRLLSALFFLTGAVFLFLLVREVIDARTGLWAAAFFLLLPLDLFYSRTFQPEAALVMSCAAGVYFFLRWTRSSGTASFLLAALFTSLAVLIKVPTLYLGLPLVYLAYLGSGRRLAALAVRVRLWLFAALVLAPVVLWYHHAHQLYLSTGLTFGFWPGQGGPWSTWRMVFSGEYWNRIIFLHLAERHLLWPGFILFLLGLLLPRASREERVFDYWMAAFLVFIVLLPERHFYHDYYQLPLMLPVAVYPAKVCARYLTLKGWKQKKRALAGGLIILCLAAMAYKSFSRYDHHLALEDPAGAWRPYRLLLLLQERTEPGDLVISALGNDPTLLYLSRRKGWVIPPELVTPAYLKDKTARGARYLAYTPLPDAPAGLDLTRALSAADEVVAEEQGALLVRLGPP